MVSMYSRFFAVCLVIFVVACSNNLKDLTRSHAKELLGQHEKFVSATELPFDKNMIETGVSEGLWHKPKFFDIELTEEGKRYFAENIDLLEFGGKLVLLEPIKRQVIEITGITDGPKLLGEGIKEVQFIWEFGEISAIVAKYLILNESGGGRYEGAALMRFYDDGWRVEELELK